MGGIEAAFTALSASAVLAVLLFVTRTSITASPDRSMCERFITAESCTSGDSAGAFACEWDDGSERCGFHRTGTAALSGVRSVSLVDFAEFETIGGQAPAGAPASPPLPATPHPRPAAASVPGPLSSCPNKPSYIAPLHSNATLMAVLQSAPQRFARIVAFAKSHAVENTVLFTVVSYSYRQALMNWLHAVTLSGIDSYVIVALDAELNAFLETRGIPCYFAGDEMLTVGATLRIDAAKKIALVWGYRYLVLSAILSSGVNVLQCDVDAFFLKDPRPRLRQVAGDVVAQRGNFPFNLGRSWGATMCFGFILYRPTVATLAWFEMSLLLFIEDPDDQVSFQRALSICSKVVWNHGVKFPAPKHRKNLRPAPWGTEEQRAKLDVGITESAITPSGGRFTFALLPFNEFPRKCGADMGFPEKKPECFLAHCVSAKSGGAKIKEAQKMKLNFLANSWENETPTEGEPTPAFIRRLGNGNHPRWNVEGGGRTVSGSASPAPRPKLRRR